MKRYVINNVMFIFQNAFPCDCHNRFVVTIFICFDTMTSNTIFGQLVIGPAGSGKTTYCQVMSDYLTKLGRNVILINIDPANDILPYKASIDINELISVENVMDNLNLGPNGSLLYAIDYLDTNFDWLVNKIRDEINSKSQNEESQENQQQSKEKPNPPYIIFDCPGQVELYTLYPSFKNLLTKLTNGKSMDLRLVCVNLIDSHYTNDPSKFISVLITSLNTMLNLELPHVNVFSKIDLLEKYGKVDFGIDFYCEVLDLNYLVEKISDDPFFEKYKKLTKALAGVIEDYSLVSFLPLDINNTKSILRVLRLIDKANGYFLTDLDMNDLIERVLKEDKDNCDANYNEFLERFT